MEPTIGVSFGLPGGAFGGGYPLNPLGNNPLVNPYGGAIGGDGVNFGSFNVNPLVSLQLGKGEGGVKKFRPLVNFHVTPSVQKLSELGLGVPGGVGGIGPGVGLGGLGGIGGLGVPGGFGAGGLGGLPFRQSTETDNSVLTSATAINQNIDIVKQGSSNEPFRFPSANAIRPLRSAQDGPYGEEASTLNLSEVGQGVQRSGQASEASFKIHHGYKGFEKAFGKGYGYGVPFPVATPVAVPQPYGVPYAVPQPVPVAQPYAVPQPVPVKVPVVEHVPVRVPVQVPVRVEVPVHVPVRVEVPVAVQVPVPVAAPYPVPVPYEQPVQVHEHYHHAAPPVAVPVYPPKASVYRPPPPPPHYAAGVHHQSVYGTPTYGYSGPVPSYSAASSYGPTPYRGTNEAQAATGYESITVQSSNSPAYNSAYAFRDSSNKASVTPGSGVRFVDSRSGESSSSPSSSSATSSSSKPSSAVKFEQAKRKRSPSKQDFVPTDSSSSSPDDTNEVRWLLLYDSS